VGYIGRDFLVFLAWGRWLRSSELHQRPRPRALQQRVPLQTLCCFESPKDSFRELDARSNNTSLTLEGHSMDLGAHNVIRPREPGKLQRIV
jgi:hypothetical protein